MKDLKNFILESRNHVDNATIGDFAKWVCLGELPDGKPGKVTNPEDCEVLLDNGWFDNFDEDNYEKGCKDIMDFLNDNWNENIKITSHETPNDWEISFDFNGKTYSVALMSYFGDDPENLQW